MCIRDRYDQKDSTSQGKKQSAFETLNNSIKGMKIGIAREYLEGVREDVRQAVLDAAKVYEDMGAQIVYFDLPALKFALPVYYIIACAEASSNLGRYDGIRYGYKTEPVSYTHLTPERLWIPKRRCFVPCRLYRSNLCVF